MVCKRRVVRKSRFAKVTENLNMLTVVLTSSEGRGVFLMVMVISCYMNLLPQGNVGQREIYQSKVPQCGGADLRLGRRYATKGPIQT